MIALIKLSQKQKCDGCKALQNDRWRYQCLLGYDINDKYNDGILYPVPKEPCPKPKTMMDFYECMEWYKK